MVMPRRPNFPVTFAKALRVAAEKRGWRAYIPFRQIIAGAIGFGVTWFIPTGTEGFWADKPVAAAVIGGVLVFNGILLGVGWGAFAKIYDIIGSTDFSDFLKRSHILDIHLMFVGGIHFALASAALVSFATLVGLVLPLPLIAEQVLFGGMVATSVNGIVEAFRATALMNDLVWGKAHSADSPTTQPNLRSISNGE
jgi:hypothetical protein